MEQEKNEVKETQEKFTDAEVAEKVETEIEEKLVAKVDEVINPSDPEEKVEEKTEEKKEVKEDKSAEETKEDEVKEDEVKEDSTQKEDESKTTNTLVDLNLPNRLIQAAKRNHVSDEEVLKLGKEGAELMLIRLADASDAVSERLGELGRKAKAEFKPDKKEEVKPPTLKLPEDFDSEAGKQLQETINALNAELASLKGKLTERESQTTLVAQAEQDKKIDGFFDGLSEQYPEFGKASSLTNAELVMRQNVWAKADDIMAGSILNGQVISLDEALTQSMSIYEGKHPSKVREKLVKEVTEREKQLIHRPTSKKEKSKVVKNEESAVKAVEEYLNRGKDGWV